MSRPAIQPVQPSSAAESAVARSQFLDASLDKAHRLAIGQHHGGVTSEHLLFALTEDPEALVVLGASTVSIERLRADITTHLSQLPNDTPAGKPILPTADLLKVLKLAAMAAQQSARKQIDGAIVMAAVIGDASTPSAGLLRAHGLTFNEVIRVLQRSAGPAVPAPAPAVVAPRSAPNTTPPDAAPPATAAASPLAAARTEEPIAAPKVTPRASTEDLLASVRARLQDAAPPPPPARKAKTADTAPVTTARPSASSPASIANSTPPATAPVEVPESDGTVGTSKAVDTASPSALVTLASEAAKAFAAAAPEPVISSTVETSLGAAQNAPSVSLQPASATAPASAPVAPSTPVAASAPVPPVHAAPLAINPEERASNGTSFEGPRTPDELPRFEASLLRASAETQINRPNALPTQPPLPLVSLAAQRNGPPPLPLPTISPQPAAARTPTPSAAPAAQPALREGPVRVPAIPPPTVDMRSLIAAMPKRLRQGQTDIIEITVPRRALEIPPAAGHRWPPLRVATMRLRAGNDDAHVELASPETLWISPPRVHQGADDATWRWRITPRNTGRIRISLAGATRIVGSEGISGEIPLGEETVEIDVARRGSRRGLVGLLLFGNLLGLGILAMLMSGRAAEFLGGALRTIRGFAGGG